ncbi:MAG: hypothetical protein JSU73_02310 [candidate division WOR-3 bacterium]|nr:MAG: hypothetical protein JSU73_02310 [candidate division WOR-3 bacterium]
MGRRLSGTAHPKCHGCTCGDRDTVYSAGSCSSVYNMLGFPAAVVLITRVRAGEESDRPASRDKADAAAEKGSIWLPVGVQVAARHRRDDVVPAVMQALEDGRQRAEGQMPNDQGQKAAGGRSAQVTGTKDEGQSNTRRASRRPS